ncbi:MAG: hypothetical protein H6867_10315 [Rhodospirillales bacterium]|nr:hypothetical protein [Rhodospirillales bacterium]MCB9995822.1 hypothetical protein [Rhodospirillales bacterium]
MSTAATSKTHHIYVPVYAVTLLLSAFLLFAIQPMFGKMILPLLGGAPAVWNTAMLFFQALLLAGYAYAHATTKFLTVRMQALLHLALLVLFFFVLPIAIPEDWAPPADNDNLVFWQLSLMTAVAGGPFFVLAASAPMLQRWFSHTPHSDAGNPYFLYAASNLGSMTALLLYPFVFEPLWPTSIQSLNWSWGYGALIAMIALSALLVWKNGNVREHPQTGPDTETITMKRRLHWLVLSFVPSSLMLGVTTFITTDVAAVPLIWVIPLAMYVGTFIIAFAKTQKLPYKLLVILHSLFLSLTASFFIFDYMPTDYKFVVVLLHLAVFFLSALLCHMRLSDAKPSARHLTEFYLIMSLGGVTGGILNALIAPLIFVVPIEYALVLVAVSFLAYYPTMKGYVSRLKEKSTGEGLELTIVMAGIALLAAVQWHNPKTLLICALFSLLILLYLSQYRRYFMIAAAITLLLHPGYQLGHLTHSLKITRDYFGVLTVRDVEGMQMRALVHGNTQHGTQPLIDSLRLTPMAYYNKPAQDIFNGGLQKQGEQKIGVLGLGVGSVACYVKEGRTYDFYEISQDVIDIAENPEFFTYLSDCGSPYKTILGDGRLKIAEQDNHIYDLIFLDVFSSDNIPIHVLTKEAFAIYRAKLKPGGMIAVNISNRFLNLAPVLNRIADDLGMSAVFKLVESDVVDPAYPDIRFYTTIYALMAEDEAALEPYKKMGWITKTGMTPHTWTDDYANLVGSLWIFRARKATD